MHGRKPEGYVDCPPVDEITDYFIRAFYIMSPSRPDGPKAITLTNINEFRQLYGIIGNVGDFVSTISEMDSLYLPVIKQRIKAAQSFKEPPSVPSGVPRSRSDLGKVSPPISKQVK